MGWLRQQLAALPAVAAGGAAQLFTPEGRLCSPPVRQGPARSGLCRRSSASFWTDAPAAGYETLDGRLSIAAAEYVRTGSGSRQPLAVLVVARPVDQKLLGYHRFLCGG